MKVILLQDVRDRKVSTHKTEYSVTVKTVEMKQAS